MRILGLGLLLAASSALAGPVPINWANPTKNVDGTTIPATGAGSLVSTKVEWGSCSGTLFNIKAGEQVVAAPATTVTLNLSPGTYCVRAFSTNTYNDTSASSNVISKTSVSSPPLPPVLVVTVE